MLDDKYHELIGGAGHGGVGHVDVGGAEIGEDLARLRTRETLAAAFLAPVDRGALFAGKFLANLVKLVVLQAIVGHDPEDSGSLPARTPNYAAGLKRGIKGLRIGVLRHYWEEDLPAHEDLRRAMDAAIGVLKTLGAKVADCRTHPMQDSLDVKVIIAETEIFSIHYSDLVKRPGNFGRDILGRMLPACLFQAADYVAASREHRRMVLEGRQLYNKYEIGRAHV